MTDGKICKDDRHLDKYEWHCTLPLGHDGDHQAVGPSSGRVFRSWPNETTPPRTWSLPAEPGPEVTRLSLRPRLGLSASLPCTATREPVASVNHWLVEREGRSLGLWTWPRLLEFFEDVTDATPTTEETKP